MKKVIFIKKRSKYAPIIIRKLKNLEHIVDRQKYFSKFADILIDFAIMGDNKDFSIDIEKILKEKGGKRANFLPKFLISKLKRILHQDEVNSFLSRSNHLEGVPWLEACVEYLDMKLEIIGAENLPSPTNGRLYTFVSNHPLGGIDGVALGAILGKHYEGHVRYLVNDILMNLRGLAPLCVPINKVGAQNRNFPAMVEACFASNNHVIMFPAGLCSRRIDGEIKDVAWRKTFITKSIETKRDIIPIHFGGHNSKFFYNLAALCKTFGIKFNIAMLFLVDEMYKNRHHTFQVKIGKPIAWETFNTSKTNIQWAQYVKDIVYKL